MERVAGIPRNLRIHVPAINPDQVEFLVALSRQKETIYAKLHCLSLGKVAMHSLLYLPSAAASLAAIGRKIYWIIFRKFNGCDIAFGEIMRQEPRRLGFEGAYLQNIWCWVVAKRQPGKKNQVRRNPWWSLADKA
jgi:hypothetical protein